MTYFPDETEYNGAPCCEGVGFVAIGWLSAGHKYATGAVSREFFRALCGLLERPWAPPLVSTHYRNCELCQFSGGATKYQFEGYSFRARGDFELFVPFQGGVFVAPATIAHSIDGHLYRPPDAFQKAVFECRDLKRAELLKRILDGGARTWIRRLNTIGAE